MFLAERVGRNTGYLFISSIITKLLSLLFIINIARKLGTLCFGDFSLANSLVQIVIVLADLGISVLAAREIARERERTAELVGKWLPLKLILSAITFVVIFMVAEILRYPLNLKILIYLFGIYYIFFSMESFFYSVFRAWEKMQYEAFIIIAEKAFIVTLGLSALYMGFGVLPLAFIYILGSASGVLTNYFILKKRFTAPVYSFEKGFYLKSIRASYPFALNTVLTMLFLYIDTVMISKMRGNIEVGWYSAGFNFVYQLRIFASVFLVASFPVFSRLAKKSPEHLKQLFIASVYFLMPIATPLAVGGVIVAKPLIMFFFGKEYIQTVAIFKILIAAIPIMYINGLLGYLMISVDKQHLVLLFLSIATVANIIANFIFIPIYGAVAAAWTSVIAESIFFFLCIKCWKHSFQIQPMYIQIFKICIASLAMGICLYILIGFHVFYQILIGILIYGAVLAMLGYFRKRLWRLLLDAIESAG